MATFTQADRPIRVGTVLGDDVLLLRGFSGEEAVSAPFRFTLDLVSEDAAIDPDKLLRTPATITLVLPDGKERILHGRISRFVELGQGEGAKLTAYRADVVPWLWFLSLSSECRIYQDMTVLEIVEQVFRDQGFQDFELKCVKSYPKREYCVQYRETHLNFVSRLLEEEGICYFFTHTKSKHVLTLADDPSAVKPCAGQSTARVVAQAGSWQKEDVVTGFEREHAAHAGKVALRDFDYLQPSLKLEGTVSGDGQEEIYDYSFPGNYRTLEDGERLARLQLEEQEQWREVIRGDGTVRSFQAGCRFELKEYYRSSANQAYHLLSVRHSARVGDYRSGEEDAGFDYRNQFQAIPASVPFRPPRVTPKPVVQGSQTAVVVGKSGEELWVDKYGRVKVQFHWDRQGKKDENSSCWVRVATTWAGKGWGAIQLPRIGQEVIVDFLEGDPDMPVITGRVYNAEQMPPYALPGAQTQSGVLSRSSKGGGADNANEFRFEDKKGSEQVFLHAEKDLKVEVENDETRDVLHDRVTTVTNDDTRTVKEGNDTLTVEKGQQAITVKAGDRTVEVKGNQTHTVQQGNEQVEIKMGNRTVELGQGNDSLTVKMGNQQVKVSLGKIAEEAMQGIELKVGQSSIKIDQTGVTIKGMTVKVEGQVQTEVKGVMTTIKGDGMLTVKGGITMIN
jgi:type VI secretion system secreted protein VgrG